MRKHFQVIGFIFAILFITYGCTANSPSSSSSTTSSSTKSTIATGSQTEACTYAQMEIENKLKSPSTAKHPACSLNTYTKLSASKYKVKSYVEAQNSFGAIVRTNYQCTVTFNNDSSYYVSCDIL